MDLDLDIVVDSEYNWEWKDKDDYRVGIREGSIQDEWVRGIEQSQEEVFDRINQHNYPLDGSWVDWQPISTWLPPKVPEKWQVL